RLAILALAALAAQTASANVVYETIFGDSSGRIAARLGRVGISTAGAQVAVEFYVENNVAPACSAGVSTIEEAMTIEATIRKYSAPNTPQLKVWCTQFSNRNSQPAFINLVLPPL